MGAMNRPLQASHRLVILSEAKNLTHWATRSFVSLRMTGVAVRMTKITLATVLDKGPGDVAAVVVCSHSPDIIGGDYC
jgi:hypothetical protein